MSFILHSGINKLSDEKVKYVTKILAIRLLGFVVHFHLGDKSNFSRRSWGNIPFILKYFDIPWVCLENHSMRVDEMNFIYLILAFPLVAGQ